MMRALAQQVRFPCSCCTGSLLPHERPQPHVGANKTPQPHRAGVELSCQPAFLLVAPCHRASAFGLLQRATTTTAAPHRRSRRERQCQAGAKFIFRFGFSAFFLSFLSVLSFIVCPGLCRSRGRRPPLLCNEHAQARRRE